MNNVAANKKASIKRLNYIYRLTVGRLCGKFVLSDTGSSLPQVIKSVSTLICGSSGCVTSKAQRQGKNPPPTADSVTMRERINYGDNSHIINGHSLVNQQPMRDRFDRSGGILLSKKGEQ